MGFFDKLKKTFSGAPDAPSRIETDAAPGTLAAPVSGTIGTMEQSPDPVFSGKAMGDGCIIKPSAETVYAPLSGTVIAAMPHAVGIAGDDGCEVLIHIGVDTVNMNGTGFTVHIQKDAHVGAGDPLVSFSKAKIADAGYDDTVMVVVTNTGDYATVGLAAAAGEAIEAGKAAVSYQ